MGSITESSGIRYSKSFVVWWTMQNMISESFERLKESRGRLLRRLFAVALFACLVFVSYRATSAVVTSATYGDRELPIYCVDTTEKKVALSFDAAWGRMLLMEVTFILITIMI